MYLVAPFMPNMWCSRRELDGRGQLSTIFQRFVRFPNRVVDNDHLRCKTNAHSPHIAMIKGVKKYLADFRA